MKAFSLVIFCLALILKAVDVDAQGCESEANAVDNCFEENCANCDPVDIDVEIDESTQLNNIEDALDVNANTAKDCCTECSTEIDSLSDCIKPSICINGECLGEESAAYQFCSVNIVLRAAMAAGFVYLVV